MTAHQIVVDCDRSRVTTSTLDDVCVMFHGDKHDVMPQAVYDSRWHRQLEDSLANLTLKEEAR